MTADAEALEQETHVYRFTPVEIMTALVKCAMDRGDHVPDNLDYMDAWVEGHVTSGLRVGIRTRAATGGGDE